MNTATAKKSQTLKGEALKQKILRVAMRHFASKGFADEIGIHKPSIYYHIGKKEALFEAVITSALDNHLHTLQQAMDEATSAEDKLRAYVCTFADNLAGENRYLANLILRQLATEDGYFPEAAMLKMADVRKILQHILNQGIEQGSFKAVNPFMIHMLIVGFFTTYAAGSHVKEKFAEVADEQDILKHAITLHEAADTI